MKLKNPIKLRLRYLILASTCLFPLTLLAETIIFDKEKVNHINFKKIPPNQFEIKSNLISIEVNKSASFLLIPFKNTKTVKEVTFEWKKDGLLNVKNSQHEETRSGDDAYLRVGIMIEGKKLLTNPLAPKWVKRVRETLNHSSNRVIYLSPNTQHQAGEHWKSPYSNEVDIIAVASEKIDQGWQLSKHIFDSSQSVVGLWIMADGDNTRSTFTTKIKTVTLE
jgi:hypothetical protein